jgi:tripartite-type tricarboxylate transporter receptor subunit TctC
LKFTHLFVAPFAALLMSITLPGIAQTFPSHPVRLIVPFPAGSATDLIGRIMAVEYQKLLGQPFIIDNKPGAQGIIGSDLVAKSPPDGHTLLLAAVSFAAAESLLKKVPYDTENDFTPISRLASTPLVLLVRPNFPAKTPNEFVAYLKIHSGKLNAGYGSSSSQMCIAQLSSITKTQITDVAYKGIPLAINDVLGGSLDFTFADLGNAMTQVQGGKLHAIGVTSKARNPLVPEWPALAEALPGLDLDAWIALIGPKGLSNDAVLALHAATLKVLDNPQIKARLSVVGFTPAPLGPSEMSEFIKREVRKWAQLARQAGVQPE